MRHVIVMAAGFLASGVAYNRLAVPYRSSYLQPASAEPLVTFLLPAAAAIIYLLVRSLLADRSAVRLKAILNDAGSNDATYEANDANDSNNAVSDIMFWIVVFVMSMHALVLAVLLGAEWTYPWAGRAIVVLFGLLLVAVGNLLPRTRPNAALGIRTARTLADRRLWMSTHRVGGYVVVTVGIVTTFSGLFANRAILPVLPGLVGLSGAMLTTMCYRRFVANA